MTTSDTTTPAIITAVLSLGSAGEAGVSISVHILKTFINVSVKKKLYKNLMIIIQFWNKFRRRKEVYSQQVAERNKKSNGQVLLTK